MDRAALERPFPADAIKSRRGPFGDISYVEGAMYIKRLQECFEGRWSWKIISHEVRGSEVVVHGALEADGVMKQAFGGSSVTTNRQTGEVVSIADDLKAAATDALKKCCSLLGIGLELYLGQTEAKPATTEPPKLRTVPAPEQTETPREQSPTPTVDRNRLTARQLRAVYALAHAQGMSDTELKANCKDAYGVLPEFLTRRDASAFIDSLSNR